MNTELVEALRRGLAAQADPVRARSQQAYMKSAMPYRGVGLPQIRALVRSGLESHPLRDRPAWEATVRTLWDEASYREEWYAAVAIARTGHQWLDAESLSLSRHLVVTGSWWDVVDETASYLVGTALATDPVAVTPVVRDWATDAELWLRRTSVVCQLRRGSDTDLDLLRHAIEATASDGSFWLRKAIGWALRQHARTDPDWVLAEVRRLGDRLSPLSRREALKHLPDAGA